VCGLGVWLSPMLAKATESELRRSALKDVSNTKDHSISLQKEMKKEGSSTQRPKIPADAAKNALDAPLCDSHKAEARLISAKKEGGSETKRYWVCSQGDVSFDLRARFMLQLWPVGKILVLHHANRCGNRHQNFFAYNTWLKQAAYMFDACV
jgi:hypothetical protein